MPTFGPNEKTKKRMRIKEKKQQQNIGYENGKKKKGGCVQVGRGQASERARERRGETSERVNIFTCAHVRFAFSFSPLFVHVDCGVWSSRKDRRFVRDMCSLLACVAPPSLCGKGAGRLKRKSYNGVAVAVQYMYSARAIYSIQLNSERVLVFHG